MCKQSEWGLDIKGGRADGWAYSRGWALSGSLSGLNLLVMGMCTVNVLLHRGYTTTCFPLHMRLAFALPISLQTANARTRRAAA